MKTINLLSGFFLILCIAFIPIVSANENVFGGVGNVYGGTIAPGATFPFETPSEVCAYNGRSSDFTLYRVFQSSSPPPESGYVGMPLMYNLEGSPPSYSIPDPGYDGEYWMQGAYCGGQNWVGKYYLQSSVPPIPDYYNVTVSVHGTGNTTVSNATVELHRNDNFSSINSALTDSNGNVTFSGIPHTDAPEVRVFATGYQYWGEVFDPYTSEILVDVYLIGTGLTPTPTPTPAGPQAGYVRTSVHVWDRSGNGLHGANIDIKDLFAGTWLNSTHDADGIFYIDTLPYAHIDIYGSFDIFANEFLPNSLLNQDTGPGGYVYFLTLFPYESGASEGNVSLYVEVKDADTGRYIPYANVQIVLSNGYSYSGSTANAGSKVFLVPNNTIVRATGTSPGYLPATVIANSGEAGSMTMTINLYRQTVTTQPTSTVPPGGVTPAVTMDPNDPALHGGDTSLKGQEMMNYLAMHGLDLVQLCFLVTVLALLGFKFGK